MSCEVRDNCKNFDEGCWKCRFGEKNEGIGDNCYSPVDRNIKHPALVAEKEQRKTDRKLARKEAKKEKDKSTSKMVRKATKAEKRAVLTLNSGRIAQDGDIKTEDLSIDFKLQSTRENPVVDMEELRKIGNDCIRAGKKHGILLIENKSGKKIVVMTEECLKEIIG